MKRIKRRLAYAAVGSIMAAGTGLVGATAASAAPAPHVSSCDSYRNNGTVWTANCRVDYGKSQSWTRCSDGTVLYGAWVGTGYWIFRGDCSGHGRIVSYGHTDSP
ncbi:hypothetical protein [Streptomyces sp. XH2]|uniref:hypothetical protein n=1 Tax=Streptomyces sp. XH2 TaxID=3412483 RepID=UPI003C7B7E37